MDTDWFAPTITYDGKAVALFENPKATISGHAQCFADECGDLVAEVTVENIESPHPLHFGLWGAIHRESIDAKGNPTSGFGGARNRCLSLVVETANGTLKADTQIFPDIKGKYDLGSREGVIRFQLGQADFHANSTVPPKYFVAPLQNFVVEFTGSHFRELDSHPLRLQRPPSESERKPDMSPVMWELFKTSCNPIIPFESEGALGFIEELRDYEDRKKALVAGNEECKLTAILVAETLGKGTDLRSVESWFPFTTMLLLGLASGCRIGSPWIEFRDSEGRLVHRLHASVGFHRYEKGFVSIHSNALPKLLSQAPSSSHFNCPEVRVAASHLLMGGRSQHQSLEDDINHFSRALDSLAGLEGCSTQDLLANCDRATTDVVTDALAAACDEIAKLASSLQAQGQQLQAEQLRRIVDRTRGSSSRDRAFGLAVAMLLDKGGFHDHKIMAEYYNLNPRPDKRTWTDLVAQFRGLSAHGGYFDFRSRHDLDDVLKVTKHLHDIALRVLLSLLSYDGEYTSPIIPGLNFQRIGWVTPATPASQLGY